MSLLGTNVPAVNLKTQYAFTTLKRRSHKCALILTRSWRYINHLLTYN